MRGQVLVVDDQPLPRQALVTELRDAGFEVFESADGEAGWRVFCRCKPDVVITDLAMPNADGIALLGRIRSQSEIPVILFSAYGTVQNVAAAFREGATDFLSSTEVEVEEIVESVSRAVAGELEGQDESPMYSYFAGGSSTMRRLREQLAALAGLDLPVFVIGELGTGRDTAVRAMHESGTTAAGKLVKVDADTRTPDLRNKPRGAVHLVDIENFPEATLDDWSERLTDLNEIDPALTSRIFFSSARPFGDWMSDRKFSSGLGKLLRHAIVEIPSLSSHPGDLPEIAQTMCERISVRIGQRRKLSTASMAYLCEHPWAGQLGELEQILERAMTLTLGPQIKRRTLDFLVREREESLASLRGTKLAWERNELLAAIRLAHGNVSKVAIALGRSRAAIYRLIAKHDIPLTRRE